MWTCPLCGQEFVNNNQSHSCKDKELSEFLKGKSEHTLSLFWHFIAAYLEIGLITVHPTKSMIGLVAKTRIVYITRLGKDFVDIVFPFKEAFSDNLCFHKIAQVPGSQQFNHHFRMYNKDDVNTEVKHFMKMAFDNGN